VQQADYFAAQGKREDGGAFTRHCRALYQQARAAYDQNDYRTARKLAEAAAGIVSALERMAQAEVRVPEPPRLK
jgi:serine/threonine-protein kinase RIO1